MKALLEAELIKLRTTRTFIALTAVAVGTSLLITGLVTTLSDPTPDSVLTDVYANDTSSLFILVLAVIGISGEWRHHTITSALLAAPERIRFLAAKTIAFAIAGAILSLLISISIAIVGTLILALRDIDMPGFGDVVMQWGRNALIAFLLGAFGVGIGALIRNQVVAIVGLLVIAFVVEPAVIALLPEVGRFLPLSALPTAIQNIPGEDVGLGDIDLLAPGLALLALLAWIGAAFAAGGALLRHRDLE